jgi:hypothetical protein
LLRQALNNGYQEGFRTGQADREDRWRMSAGVKIDHIAPRERRDVAE